MASARDSARSGFAGFVLCCGIAFGGCDSDDQAPAATQPSETADVTTPTTPSNSSLPSDVTEPATAPVEIVGVYEAVEFYPACGNETLDHQGVTWYTLVHSGLDPVDPELQQRVDEVLAVEREDSPVAGVHGLTRVPIPGPGDEIGTLVVWADGVARWVSASGDLDVWMINDEIVYTWAC
jgi:hypothetical protein